MCIALSYNQVTLATSCTFQRTDMYFIFIQVSFPETGTVSLNNFLGKSQWFSTDLYVIQMYSSVPQRFSSLQNLPESEHLFQSLLLMSIPPNTQFFHDQVTVPSFCNNMDIITSVAASFDIQCSTVNFTGSPHGKLLLEQLLCSFGPQVEVLLTHQQTEAFLLKCEWDNQLGVFMIN